MPEVAWRTELDAGIKLAERIAELEAERDGLKKFIDKQAWQVRQLQRRLAAAGLDAGLEPLPKSEINLEEPLPRDDQTAL